MNFVRAKYGIFQFSFRLPLPEHRFILIGPSERKAMSRRQQSGWTHSALIEDLLHVNMLRVVEQSGVRYV